MLSDRTPTSLQAGTSQDMSLKIQKFQSKFYFFLISWGV
ncbi:unnamed protein product [Acanthoscelides obtectus]|uniref:Uncharacterized protein n=1 Tax=Acanthoscelides obtectus TaxID=200917 RepID=A0A9P0P1Y2_ACAOB|nr:unnamed protein product [Acanthoscelides obtectus]CAK1666388.1 hypothetical protein AOBTE_LOCUS25293 [Acanthoscelides obtectus]